MISINKRKLTLEEQKIALKENPYWFINPHYRKFKKEILSGNLTTIYEFDILKYWWGEGYGEVPESGGMNT